ncbi:MAG: 50S ribosomal protein L23 [Bacteroidia bacterium]
MSILKRPLITEKFTALAEKLKKYSFEVDKKATKDDIKKAVEKLYGVNVVNINTMIQSGKTKTRYTKKGIFTGRKPTIKKAIVTLEEGQEIDFFKNV